MSLKRPDTEISEEIADINREFLRLLTHPAIRGAPGVLGLDGGVLEGLCQVNREERELVAASPCCSQNSALFPG